MTLQDPWMIAGKKKKEKKCGKCLRGNERRLVEDKALDGYDFFIKFDFKCSGVVVLKKKNQLAFHEHINSIYLVDVSVCPSHSR